MRSLTVLIHGHQWPAASWALELRDALATSPSSGPFRVVDVVDAREGASRAEGAAVVLNRAAQRASSDLLLVVEAGCRWDRQLLEGLSEAVSQSDVLAVAAPGHSAAVPAIPPRAWNDAWIPAAINSTSDLTTLVERATAVGLGEWAWQLHAGRPRMWALRKTTWRALGGLDPDLWCVGLVEDLADRAEARGVPVRLLAAPPAEDSSHDAWPLRAHLLQFLALRAVLLSSVRAQPLSRAGRALGVAAALGWAEAWRQADIPPERLRFGGEWGAPDGLLSRWTAPPAATNPLWPARQAATMIPILAMDSFLELLVARSGDPAHSYAPANLETHGHDPAPPATPPAVPAAALTPGTLGDQPAAITVDPAPQLPSVSVVVVNWNGREHLEPCFSSLLASDYPQDLLEIICVDNGSTDDSRDLLTSRFPQVKMVALRRNHGFTGGNAAGVRESRGDVLMFFNNDMRVEPTTVRSLVAGLSDEFPCTAAVVRSWNGRRIDFVRGSLNFEAHGFQDHYGEAWRPERAPGGETFFPNGGAFAIRRAAYLDTGGFDERFFAYYDDVDLGYAIRQNGGRIRVVADAQVYHRHGATSRRYPQGQKRFLMERNAVWTVLKRYEPASLDRALGAVLLLAARRLAQETVLRRRHPLVQSCARFSSRCRKRPHVLTAAKPSTVYDPNPTADNRRSMGREDGEAPVVVSIPVESLAAVGEALRGLAPIVEFRQAVAGRPRIADSAVFAVMGRPLAYGSPLASYQAAHDALVEVLQLADVFRRQPRLLIITHEPLRKRLSGPGVRVLELGRALAPVVRVTIASPASPELVADHCTLAAYDPARPSSLRRLAEDADVLLVQGFALTQFPFLIGMHVPIAVDLYCPFTIEYLEMKTAEARACGAGAPDVEVQMEALSVLEVQNAQLRHGDFFLCASERQRDFWIGTLHTAGRVNTHTYAADPSLRSLVDLVPFGVSEQNFDDAVTTAQRSAGPRVLKGVRPGIGPEDKVLFWGGSLLDWQDPLTLIRAVAELARTRRDVKLFFAGTRHPNPQIAPMQIVEASISLARDLGVHDTAVFFNDWVPYEERAAYLAESDLGLSTHRLHLETHFSFRTRMLDYIWAAVPIVCTEGDYFADLVRTRGLGLVVPPGDVKALASAITRLLDDPYLMATSRMALYAVRDELRWGRVTEPLRRFVSHPRFAADHELAVRSIRANLRNSYRASKWLKRTALQLGASESGIERLKSFTAVQLVVRLRNRLALSRAGRLR